uniref:Uncharacterized protein n=1 Tax=Romanomermis culicivorax TaxID=13658 RepID=A0A915JQF3_ROMCU
MFFRSFSDSGQKLNRSLRNIFRKEKISRERSMYEGQPSPSFFLVSSSDDEDFGEGAQSTTSDTVVRENFSENSSQLTLSPENDDTSYLEVETSSQRSEKNANFNATSQVLCNVESFDDFWAQAMATMDTFLARAAAPTSPFLNAMEKNSAATGSFQVLKDQDQDGGTVVVERQTSTSFDPNDLMKFFRIITIFCDFIDIRYVKRVN